MLSHRLLLILLVPVTLITSSSHGTNAQINEALIIPQWSSDESEVTWSVAWGDYDRDGDLDLASGNGGQPNRLHRNDNGTLTTSATWSSDDEDDTRSIAWGDYDNDGDLDLAAGNHDQPNRLYRNDNGALVTSAVWSSDEADNTMNIDWGDYDNDGDLDLVVGNFGEPNRLYRNDAGMLTTSAVWSSDEADNTTSVDWGDYDNDGDLDLVVGNDGEPNRLYRNDGGMLTSSPVWSSQEQDNTLSTAWGDVDGDGDLDLVAGNYRQANRLYRNEDGNLTNEAVWSSVEEYETSSIAWGDYDSDGDLDLLVGNFFQPNQLYANDGGTLTASAIWASGEEEPTDNVAWGDYDGDGDLDIAIGSAFQNRLYRNDGAGLATTSVWSSTEAENTWSVAWSDYDGDGDLDLAVGNYNDEPSRVYRNDEGQLTHEAIWSSAEVQLTYNVAWGDYDGDGDLDLAIANDNQPNQLYGNTGGMLTDEPVWSSDDFDSTAGIAWGDYDGDGDLDLAVGNYDDEPNRVYQNDEGELTHTAIWSSAEVQSTFNVAWGDYDNDGDLDLAAANESESRIYGNYGGEFETAWIQTESEVNHSVSWGDYDGDGDLDLAMSNLLGPNRLYRNDDGQLTTSPAWSSSESDGTFSVAWGDYDTDGDLDLAAGSIGLTDNRLYHNEGNGLANQSIWSATSNQALNSVAWGDYDGDGDLDLAVGNAGSFNQIYQNQRRNNVSPLNDPPYVVIPRPGVTDNAYFFSTSEIIQSAIIPITYSLFDPEGDIVTKIFPEFSPNGGGQWFLATPGSGGDGTTNLAASPDGISHIFIWNAGVDIIKSDNVVFRIRAQPDYTHSPILWPALGAQSFPFRVEAAPWFVRVADEGGQAIEGAFVYYGGQLIEKSDGSPYLTDRAGLLRLDDPVPGTPLVALSQIHEQPTNRAAHDGWAYRTYITSLNLDPSGGPRPDAVSEPGQQPVTVRRDDPLILFNIVASIEWNSDEAYFETIERAFEHASDYLYDVSDGQMAFGQVNIYDNAEHWADADFQISTKNTVRPYAFIGGITSADTAHSIRIGRFWDGGSGNQGAWDQPNGYRTLIHEFGHYALYLHDEYFVRIVNSDGVLTGQAPAACTGLEVIDNQDFVTNASIMYYQYNASELADSDRWTINCQNTEQARVNGQPDWETVLQNYAGSDWNLNTPSSRGAIMAGPDKFPEDLLPFPAITRHGAGVDGIPRELTVLGPNGKPFPSAIVALYTTPGAYTVAIDQGLTDQNGKLTVYGAAEGDTIQVASFDGAYAGAVIVNDNLSYVLTLSSTQTGARYAQTTTSTPYLNLIPGSEGDSLLLEVHGAQAGNLPLTAVVIPGDGGGSPQLTSLAYSAAKDAYTGQVSFAGVGLGSGGVQVSGIAGGQLVTINSDYNLMQVFDNRANDLGSEDGNFQLHIAAGSLLNGADAYAMVYPTGNVPGSLPGGSQVLASAYEIRFSAAATELINPGVLTMHYHPSVTGHASDLAIYRWDPVTNVWSLIGGQPNEVDNSLSVAVTHFGIYVLGGHVSPRHEIFLPLMLNNAP